MSHLTHKCYKVSKLTTTLKFILPLNLHWKCTNYLQEYILKKHANVFTQNLTVHTTMINTFHKITVQYFEIWNSLPTLQFQILRATTVRYRGRRATNVVIPRQWTWTAYCCIIRTHGLQLETGNWVASN